MLRLYRDWRMAKIFFLGFISGFPWLLIASMVALWLKEEGLSRSASDYLVWFLAFMQSTHCGRLLLTA